MVSTAVLIPARYGSARFPGKPLCDLGGKPMIERVYDNALAAGYDTYVLTDDVRVSTLFADYRVIVDDADYENGTERCAGAIKKSALLHDYDQFINVQGDMPDITVDAIEAAVWGLERYSVSTVYTAMPEENQTDPNSVKLVQADGKALWFGRGMTGYGHWHLGVYGYSRNALEAYPYLHPSVEEEVEKLEQLRWLKNGCDIAVTSVSWDGIEINTPDDMEKWNEQHRTQTDL